MQKPKSDGDAREQFDRIESRLARIEQLLQELVKRKRARERAGVRRGRSVAERAAARARTVYKPTDAEIAAARRALARK